MIVRSVDLPGGIDSDVRFARHRRLAGDWPRTSTAVRSGRPRRSAPTLGRSTRGLVTGPHRDRGKQTPAPVAATLSFVWVTLD